MAEAGRRRQRLPRPPGRRRRRILGWMLVLVFFAVIPPVFLHFRLRRFSTALSHKCGWLDDPPLVCAHGGDNSKAAPNTVGAYREALLSQVDCIEIDVSRSSDGAFFALHDRDLQRITGNHSTRVGHWRKDELNNLDIGSLSPKERENLNLVSIDDALQLVSNSVKRVVLDAKVGPPMYEKGLAEDLLSMLRKTNCSNCIIWAKSDMLVRDIIWQSRAKSWFNLLVGYIVMKDFSTGSSNRPLRIKDASVVGVYHPLIEDSLMRSLHGKGKKVYAWTVDDEPSMQRMLSEGVDAVITSLPRLLQEVMRRTEAKCRQRPLLW